MTTMLYKYPGDTDINGKGFDYTIVDDDKVEQAIADGWHLTTGEAVAASAADKPEDVHATVDDNAPPTRAELEAKAAELGIKFDGRTGDKKLGELITEKLKD